MNLYISDLHFGHKNVILFDHRPFSDVDTMDHCLIQLWIQECPQMMMFISWATSVTGQDGHRTGT